MPSGTRFSFRGALGDSDVWRCRHKDCTHQILTVAAPNCALVHAPAAGSASGDGLKDTGVDGSISQNTLPDQFRVRQSRLLEPECIFRKSRADNFVALIKPSAANGVVAAEFSDAQTFAARFQVNHITDFEATCCWLWGCRFWFGCFLSGRRCRHGAPLMACRRMAKARPGVCPCFCI